MGYLIIGSEDGVSIIKPHDGAWAERTEGWPKSLSTTTTPALTDNDVRDVCAGFSDQPRFDPRTGGPMPTFGLIYGSGADTASLLKDDGKVFDDAGTLHEGVGCAIDHGKFYYMDPGTTGDNAVSVTNPISEIQADDWTENIFTDTNSASVDAANTFGAENAFAKTPNLAAGATAEGLSLIAGTSEYINSGSTRYGAMVNRTYNTGWLVGAIKGAWLANSKTVDRSFKENTLTENGTVTEAAVASGAELKGYSGFTATDNLTRASDADWDVVTTGPLYMSSWYKSAGNSTQESLIGFGNGAGTIEFYIAVDWDGTVFCTDDGATAQVILQSTQVVDDDVPHKIDFVRRSSTGRELWIDGILVASNTTDAGSLTGTGTLPLAIGVDHSGSLFPVLTGVLSLARLSVTAPTAAQIQHMYETERRMFEANAKCLLQSGTTDAVLDVSIDPITGKVGVVQTDDEVLFDGLVIDEEPALPAGAANWEHVARYGGDRLVLTNANLYADIAAKDIREDLEELRGKVSALPKGPDLGRAKAFLVIDTNGPTILQSFNIASITKLARAVSMNADSF